MGAKIYWAINWLGVFCNCNYLYYIYIVLCVWAVFFVPEFSCSLRPESFLPEFLFPRADTIQCFAFLPERNVFMRLPPALWTTTIVSLFSTHLNKCKALYIEIYSCGNKPNEKDAMWMPSRQQMSHSERRACHLRRVVHVVERAAIKQSSRKLLSNSIALAWIQIFSSSTPRFYFAFLFASCSSVSIFP
jgi:hypothetical protein